MSADSGHVLDPAGRPLDRIAIRGLTVRGHHGVFAAERQEGQEFVVDVVLHLDTREAGAHDDLAATVDYGRLATTVADRIRGEAVALLETLSADIARICLRQDRVVAVDVALHKQHAPISERFDDVVVAVRRFAADRSGESSGEPSGDESGDPLDAIPDAPVRAVLALGSNLGDRAGTLRSALLALDGRGPHAVTGVQVDAVSPPVETDPVGGPDQPDYLNAVALVRTTRSPRGLLAACQAVEAALGRTRDVRWGPRTLDVDVVAYGEVRAAGPDLELPHPRAAERAFVLLPWLAVDPGAVLPGPGPEPILVADLPAADPDAPDAPGVRPFAGGPLW